MKKPAYLLPLLLLLLGQTDFSEMTSVVVSLVVSIIPVFVLLMVIRLLFSTFKDIKATKATTKARLAYLAPTLALLGQTISETAMYSSSLNFIFVLIFVALPVLILVSVIKLIFRTIRD